MEKPRIDLHGKVFGRLIPFKYLGGVGHKWKCRCVCGKVAAIIGQSLREGHTKSCGCLWKEQAKTRAMTHGHSREGKQTGIYMSWRSMVSRIHTDSYHGKRYYEAKGITLNPLWRTFEMFLKDVGGTWFLGAVLHRRNGWEGYWKKNCVWMSKSEHTALHNKLRGRKQYG